MKVFCLLITLVVSEFVYCQQNSSGNKNNQKTIKKNTSKAANVRYVPTSATQPNTQQTGGQQANVKFDPNQNNASSVNVAYSPNQTSNQNNNQQGTQSVNLRYNPNQTNSIPGNSNTNPLQYNPNTGNTSQPGSVVNSNTNPLLYSPNTNTGIQTYDKGQTGGSSAQQASMNYVPAGLKDIKYFVEIDPRNVITKDVFDKSYYVVQRIQMEVIKWGAKELVLQEVEEVAMLNQGSKILYYVYEGTDTGETFYHILTGHK